MLRKQITHSQFTAVAISKETREKLRKFALDNNFTLSSIAETAIEVFIDSYPHLQIKTMYKRDVVIENIEKHQTKLKPIYKETIPNDKRTNQKPRTKDK